MNSDALVLALLLVLVVALAQQSVVHRQYKRMHSPLLKNSSVLSLPHFPITYHGQVFYDFLVAVEFYASHDMLTTIYF